ncbi:MAG: FAD/NAD(P)-binding protein [Oscillospiraceae bacterium]|jgi:NAD(P)H-flavin reductase|nr:FAD/NAD(P)-binding protein [Oscillospiraceae bacterium]
MSINNNPYLPIKAVIEKIIQETSSPDLDVKTFKIRLLGDAPFEFMPGQFVEFSVPGMGECPFGFASMLQDDGSFDITIKRTGKVTNRIHALDEGSHVWIRGPFGNTFPMELMEKSDILIVAGGIGLAPLRPFIQYVLGDQRREKYGKVDMLLAARSSGDHCFTYDHEIWRSSRETTIEMTIDKDEPGWNGLVGFPHNLIKDKTLNMENLYAILCGPPIMIKAVQGALTEMGLPLERLYTTLEMRMTCGVGKCAKCNIGHQYICVDGPVYSMAELSKMPDEY